MHTQGKDCRWQVVYKDSFLQSNALRTEVIRPKAERCRLKQDNQMLKKHDPTGALWFFSGGCPLHFGACYNDCPEDKNDYE